MLGAIIKKRRLELNMSQESLCKGICAVSYLSKIETGRVLASDDIISSLLGALGIAGLSSDKHAQELEAIIQAAWEAITFGHEDAYKKSYDTLAIQHTFLEHSVLAIDWRLLKAYTFLEGKDLESYTTLIKDLDYFVPYFEPMHHHYYCFLSGLFAIINGQYVEALTFFSKAQTYQRNGHILFHIASSEYLFGNYLRSIDIGNEAFTLLSLEGNIHYTLEMTQILAAAYSNIKQLQSAIGLYKRLLHMGTYLKDDIRLNSVYYNLGATYLVCHEYALAQNMLCKLEPFMDRFDDWQWLLISQKMILCDIALKCDNRAQKRLFDVMHRLSSSKVSQEHSLIKSFYWLSLYFQSDAPLKSPQYLDAIKDVFERSQKDSHFGFALFYSAYYIDALKAHRRYKEALEVQGSLEREIFL